MPGRDFWNNRRWRLERIFALLFILWASLSLTRAPGWVTEWPFLGVFFLGGFLAYRYVRTGIRRTIWSLRNRLIVTYIFIGVVPVLLVVLLAGLFSYILFGQVADYLIATEIDRHTDSLYNAAETLSLSAPEVLDNRIDAIAKRLSRRFPNLQILVLHGEKRFRYPLDSNIEPPSKAWSDYAGLVGRGGEHFEFVHQIRGDTEVTILAPLTSDMLSNMVPGMADVQFIDIAANSRAEKSKTDPDIRNQQHLPPGTSRLDFEIVWLSHPSMPDWDKPSRQHTGIMSITTRPSAVINALSGRSFEMDAVLIAFMAVAGIFLLVELVSAVIGVSLTRTVTAAVHALYKGTQRVTAGDFSHRIQVKGNDQLAELGHSFNSMTENLERLIVVAKEKERLESEIEIARGVQTQLFPKAAPAMRTIQLSGSCRPARMVSGDYYDFLCLPDGQVAIAIGDVAGKGIAAALLMASIQSIMRTQLTAGPRASGTVSQMVCELNRQLYANTSAEKYATFCFGLYEEERQTFTYTNAGHLPPILLHAGQPQLLEVTGTVVGAFPHMHYEERTIAMEPGDILLAYTDGIVEPENAYGVEFGTDRMMDLVVKYQTESSDEIIGRIMDAVPEWTCSSELSDDMTVVLARRTLS